jgi:ubiquinone/menaquinone biosynthesis C-methylase UbiE
MPDLYAQITEIPNETQEILGDALTVRANEEQMQEMRRRYFSWIDIPEGGRALEIGSGTGHVTADLLKCTNLSEALGLDPSPVLVGRAMKEFGETPGLSFMEGDARSTGLPDEHFDLVVFHTSLCHIPGPDKALAEAFRVLKAGGMVAVFDGDYATITTSLGENDPLQVCMEHAAANLIHDKWLCRTLPNRLRNAGFKVIRRDAHPYLAKGSAAYFLTLVTRGADFMVNDGSVSEETAESLKAEAKSRVENGSFFGFISFNSVIAHRPA